MLTELQLKEIAKKMESSKEDLRKVELPMEVKEVDNENYRIRAVFSTGDVDRHGEIVDQKGWRIDEYLKNNVILFAHDHWQPAVGRGEDLHLNAEGNLEGWVKFAAEEYDFAMTLFKLYAGGYMHAFSAGFRNNRYEVDQENDIVILKENTLFEISCVNVPANAMALAKAKGVDVGPIERMKEMADIDIKTLHDDIRALTEALKASVEPEQASPKGRKRPNARKSKTAGNNKISVHVFNKAIRGLLKAKKTYSSKINLL